MDRPLSPHADLEAAGKEGTTSFDWRMAAVDARLGTGDVGGALEVAERAPQEQRASLARRCDAAQDDVNCV